MRSSIHTQLALGAAIVVAIAIPVAAGATDSGKVGRLAFGLIAADGNTDIYSVMPDGSAYASTQCLPHWAAGPTSMTSGWRRSA